MTILNELLSSLEKSELDEQLKQICDQIMKEENPKLSSKGLLYQPKGPNIFLSIECNDRTNNNFLCLERESKEKYIISLWSKKNILSNPETLKRKKVWEVPHTKSEKILKFYAETLKYVKGE
jgi:hypothetical protein